MKILKKIFGKIDGRKAAASARIDELAELAGRRAENYFQEHRLSCSEAALLVINSGFGGDLSADQVLRLGSGFAGGIGGSGCVCGALSGAVMALGLFLGPVCPNGLGKRSFRKLVAAYHEAFREESGAVCCRDLIADFRKDRKGKGAFCRELTGRSTGEAVRLILRHRPELAEKADREFLRGHDSATAVLRKLMAS
ncbi:MAG: C-GCAxxG-C-C family protein [Desulfobulbales bacterium]|nr:C-GCAxxG-C-C family protein [Desulfobulbales bacterium]